MREIKESDWKLYRDLHQTLVERYCEQVLEEVRSICTKARKNSHQCYLDLYRTMERRDRELGDLFNSPKRSTALLQILTINARGLFTPEEFARFSLDVRELAVRFRE
jgi:hypothetical protein